MKYSDTRITARYQETDKMGIIHHSVYPVWFEAARTDFIKACGHSYSLLEKKGLMLPLISLEAEYLNPSYYEDTVIIRSRLKNLSATRMTVSYEVFRADDDKRIISRGSTTHVFTDRDMKPVNAKKKFPEVHEALKKIYEEK